MGSDIVINSWQGNSPWMPFAMSSLSVEFNILALSIQRPSASQTTWRISTRWGNLNTTDKDYLSLEGELPDAALKVLDHVTAIRILFPVY
jgi:hypothetical protein